MGHPLFSLSAEIGDTEAAQSEADWVVLAGLNRAPGRFLSQRLDLMSGGTPAVPPTPQPLAGGWSRACRR